MKRISALILVLVLMFSCLSSCGSVAKEDRKPGDVITLNVYNWGEYISDGSEGSYDTNAEFEKFFNEHLSEKYGGIKVKVNYTTYPTNEDMYSKLSSGSGSYDVICPSDYMIERLIAEGMIQPLNWAGLKSESQFDSINPDYLGNFYDKYNVYSIPYTYGRTGIIYNTTMVDEEDVGSWDVLWNEKYKGNILQFNNPRDAFGTAMYWQGFDINSDNEEDWNRALELLKEQKPLLQGYVNDEIFDKMVGGSAAIAPYFVGDFVTMYADNEDLKFSYPKEGGNIFVDALCIPTSSKNPDIAMEYINFMISPEAAVANAIYLGYASPSLHVVSENGEYNEDYKDGLIYDYFLDAEDEENPTEEELAAANEKAEYVLRLLYETEGNGTYPYEDAYYHNFTPKIQRHVNGLWEDLKVFGTAELWIHITSAVLVASILTFAIYNVVVKKRRSRDYRLRDKQLKSKK